MKWAKLLTRLGCSLLSRPVPRGESDFVSVWDRLSQNLPQLYMVELIKGKGTVQQVNGMPIDDREAFPTGSNAICPRYTPASIPSEPRRIRVPFNLGIQAINGLLTCGQSQRLAIVADAVTPWRSLLGALAYHAQASIDDADLDALRSGMIRSPSLTHRHSRGRHGCTLELFVSADWSECSS